MLTQKLDYKNYNKKKKERYLWNIRKFWTWTLKKETTGGGIWEWGERCVEATALTMMAEDLEFVRVNLARQPRVALGFGIFSRRYSPILSLYSCTEKIMFKNKFFLKMIWGGSKLFDPQKATSIHEAGAQPRPKERRENAQREKREQRSVREKREI